MNWSRYNTLFHSERFGYFLYNSLINKLHELGPRIVVVTDCGRLVAYHRAVLNLAIDHPASGS